MIESFLCKRRQALLAGEIDVYPEYTGNAAYFFNRADDPVWKDAHCRNKRKLEVDEQTRFAHQSDTMTVMTYLLKRGNESEVVKNVYVPVYIGGKRWGNFEFAFRDNA